MGDIGRARWRAGPCASPIRVPGVTIPARMSPQVSALLERIGRWALPEGISDCRGAWLRQEGEIRFTPDRPWLPFRAEQWFLGSGIEFLWQAQVRMAPLLRARVVDSFQGGQGKLVARLLGFIPVARSVGPATDKGEALRGLAELPWRPFAFREASLVTWEAAGPDKLRAVFDNGNTQASVDFDIDADGRVLGGSASSRPRIVGKAVVNTPWSGSFRDYLLFDRVRVPTVAEVSWHLPEGLFTYWRGRVLDYRIVR